MKSILLVEDEYPFLQRVLEMKFWRKEKYRITAIARNGAEGLALYVKKKPDAVITDIDMPVKDGLSMIEDIRSLDSHIPVIIFSSNKNFSCALRAINLGVNEYLVRGFMEEEAAVMKWDVRRGPFRREPDERPEWTRRPDFHSRDHGADHRCSRLW